MLRMKDLFSPGNLITVTGGVLTVIGVLAYLQDNANLSLPTFFYGIVILLGGLALKSSELPPAKHLVPDSDLNQIRATGKPELVKLVKDVTRWRYGQKAHLESSLEVLKLWDEKNPPFLLEIEELEAPAGYGLRLRFQLGEVPLERWQEKQDRLSRFFAKDMLAELDLASPGVLDLTLLPANGQKAAKGQHGES